jgi:Flp pilus assembly pilin Flp
MDWLLQVAKEYGLFAALVCYVIWDSRQREHKYIAVIQTLSIEVKERLTKIETALRRKP